MTEMVKTEELRELGRSRFRCNPRNPRTLLEILVSGWYRGCHSRRGRVLHEH